MSRKIILPLVFALLLAIIYRSWFISPVLTGGDWWNVFPEQQNLFSFPPLAWDSSYNLGASNIYVLWNVLPLDITVSILGNYLSFSKIALLTYFIPFILIGFLGCSRLYSYLFPNYQQYGYVSGFLYIANTYILMVVGGGQLLLGVSYACIPLVILLFAQLVDTVVSVRPTTAVFKNRKILAHLVILSLVWALQLLADPRFVYVSVVLCISYLGYTFFINTKYDLKQIGISVLTLLILPGSMVILLHTFWILPLFLSKQTSLSQLGTSYSYGDQAISFFSFAKIEDSLSLLHPNWPENIFGKVSFYNPEFMLMPLLAFCSLFFIGKGKKVYGIVPLLASIGLIGAFLAKGTNDPFGAVYLFFSHYIPGFQLFRDPIKWYPLVALSFSLLIPFTLASTLSLITKRGVKILILGVCGIYMLWVLAPALTGRLSGTFQYHEIPKEYISLKNMLNADTSFSRTLWVPHIQRYGFRSGTHPQISANDFFLIYDNKKLIAHLAKPETEEYLRKSAIKYVIVPQDSEEELFLEDRKYNEEGYKRVVTDVTKVPYLQFEKSYGNIVVFSLKDSVDHFWIANNQTKISSIQESSVKYRVQIVDGKKGHSVIFSEQYNPLWKAYIGETPIRASLYDKRFSSFVLPKDGTYEMVVVYQPQEWVNYGLIISSLVLGILFLSLVLLKTKK